jgi:uncharacterized Zn-finger protein
MPEFFTNNIRFNTENGSSQENGTQERFSCSVCGKSYLRKRHLQRHTRDECVNIPPRFHCELCPSKFRRKYHLVRHMASKHGQIMPTTPQQKHSIAVKEEILENNRDIKNILDKFSVEALMMKQDNFQPSDLPLMISNAASVGSDMPLNDLNIPDYSQLGLQQTFQNLKNLFVNYSLNNVSN